MRRAVICIASVLTAAVGTGTARASTPTAPAPAPTSAQIRRAVTHAERSSYLWATVNICRPRDQGGGLVGIRGEMGALWFRSTLSMTIQIRQYDTARKRFIEVRAASRTVSLGPLTHGVHQDGAAFHYSSDTGLLDATVTFTWTRNGRRLGEVTRTTTSGHPTAAFAQPARHSAATCRL